MPALNALRTSDAAYNLRLPAEYAHQSPRNAPDPASQRALDTRLLRLRQTLAPAPPTSTTVATEFEFESASPLHHRATETIHTPYSLVGPPLLNSFGVEGPFIEHWSFSTFGTAHIQSSPTSTAPSASPTSKDATTWRIATLVGFGILFSLAATVFWLAYLRKCVRWAYGCEAERAAKGVPTVKQDKIMRCYSPSHASRTASVGQSEVISVSLSASKLHYSTDVEEFAGDIGLAMFEAQCATTLPAKKTPE